jgi:hypothetical protein
LKPQIFIEGNERASRRFESVQFGVRLMNLITEKAFTVSEYKLKSLNTMKNVFIGLEIFPNNSKVNKSHQFRHGASES